MSDIHHNRLGPPPPDHERGVQQDVARFVSALKRHDMDLPEPAPEVVMDANGAYWRRYPDHLSMPPVSDDNEPLAEPVAVYRFVGWESTSDQPLHESEGAP